MLLLMLHFPATVGFMKYSISPGERGVGMIDNSCVEDIFSEFKQLSRGYVMDDSKDT